jgi:hypothetical protein
VAERLEALVAKTHGEPAAAAAVVSLVVPGFRSIHRGTVLQLERVVHHRLTIKITPTGATMVVAPALVRSLHRVVAAAAEATILIVVLVLAGLPVAVVVVMGMLRAALGSSGRAMREVFRGVQPAIDQLVAAVVVLAVRAVMLRLVHR